MFYGVSIWSLPMGGQPGKPKPIGNPPIRYEPQRPPIEEPQRAAGPRRHWLTTYSASARCCRDSGKLGLFPHTADFWSTERSPHLSSDRQWGERRFLWSRLLLACPS